jgi:hypothetical protein
MQVCYISSVAAFGEGVSADLEWKAWVESDDSCWWDLTRVADTLLLGGKGHTLFHVWLKKFLPQLRATWTRLGLEEASVFRKSAKALASSSLSEPAEAQNLESIYQVPVVSTVGLMVFLLTCISYFRTKVDQHRAMAALMGWFLRCMEPGIATPGGELLQLSPGTSALCGYAADGGPCLHLQPCLLQVADTAGAFHEQLAVMLGKLWARLSICRACCQHLGELMRKVAAHVDGRVPVVAYTQDPCKAHTRDLCGRLKRPCDEDFKRAVATKVIEEGKAASSAQYLRAHAEYDPSCHVHWEEKRLLELQSASWIGAAGTNVQCVVVPQDAGRFGSPAEDTLVMVASCMRRDGTQFTTWLPVQVGIPIKGFCVEMLFFGWVDV